MHFSFKRIYARGETTEGGLLYSIKTDGDVERLEWKGGGGTLHQL